MSSITTLQNKLITDKATIASRTNLINTISLQLVIDEANLLSNTNDIVSINSQLVIDEANITTINTQLTNAGLTLDINFVDMNGNIANNADSLLFTQSYVNT